MRMVQHGSDSIKSEAIKFILVHPESNVGQQESGHLKPTKIIINFYCTNHQIQKIKLL